MEPSSEKQNSPAVGLIETGGRRGKRRHASVIREPLALLRMAVQLDERNISFLEQPIETGRLHGNQNNQKEFWEAVGQVQLPRDAPNKAMTPIILSGLLHCQMSNQDGEPTTEDLVNYVTVLRAQAKQRYHRSQRQQQWRKIGLFSCVIIFLVSNFYYGLATVSLSMYDLGYHGVAIPGSSAVPNLKACSDFDEGHRLYCYQANARVWASVRDYPLHLFSGSNSGNTCVHGSCPAEAKQQVIQQLSSIPGRSRGLNHHGHAPYALHTLLTQGFRRSGRRKKNNVPESVRWLGDSRLLQLIRPYVGTTVLDIGCGIGSLLFSLSPKSRKYTGIALSPAEINTALRLVQHHEVPTLHSSVTFRQDTPYGFFQRNKERLDRAFHSIVAIESLSRQPHSLDAILKEITNALKPNGKLIIVDDVIRIDPIANHSDSFSESLNLWTHSNWTKAFSRHGLRLEEARDLGLEFTLPQLMQPPAANSGPWNFQINAFDYLLDILQSVSFFQHMARLFRHVLQLHYNETLRATAHQEGNLLYVLYVVTKPA
mmetsp:Transcript_8250/g.12691  ORF Transcript_8250/g.12691 Transcript_8250/m.12691 type:complete len:541 (+) Transcript_8250:353-1975(+)